MKDKPKKPNVIMLFGPTATGKSETGIKLARMFNGEIISADSMQVYKNLELGTAKLTKDKWQGIVHHLIDVVEPDERFSVADYQKLALEAISHIHNKGKLPFIVGGTGLYFKVLLYGIFDSPKCDDDLRKKLFELQQEIGMRAFWERLKSVDEEAANRIAITDVRRIIRALEVYELTGKPLTQHFKDDTYEPTFEPIIIALQIDRKVLYERIEHRCDIMLSSGLIDEVKHLLANNVSPKHTAMQAIGYRHIFDYLDGAYDYNEMERLFKRDSRRFAKRQISLFSQLENVNWFDYNDFDSICEYVKTQLATIIELNKASI